MHMSAMMGGGAGGALMYLIFDPDMKNFPEARTEIEEYVFRHWSNRRMEEPKLLFDVNVYK